MQYCLIQNSVWTQIKKLVISCDEIVTTLI